MHTTKKLFLYVSLLCFSNIYSTTFIQTPNADEFRKFGTKYPILGEMIKEAFLLDLANISGCKECIIETARKKIKAYKNSTLDILKNNQEKYALAEDALVAYIETYSQYLR